MSAAARAFLPEVEEMNRGWKRRWVGRRNPGRGRRLLRCRSAPRRRRQLRPPAFYWRPFGFVSGTAVLIGAPAEARADIFTHPHTDLLYTTRPPRARRPHRRHGTAMPTSQQPCVCSASWQLASLAARKPRLKLSLVPRRQQTRLAGRLPTTQLHIAFAASKIFKRLFYHAHW